MVGPLAHLLAGGAAHFADAVSDAHCIGHAIAAMAAQSANIGAAAGVGMAAGRANGLACNKQTRTDDISLIDRFLDAPIGAARIADGGEAAINHALEQANSTRRHQGERHIFEAANRHFREEDMDMAVDEARHHRLAAAIDDCGRGALDRLV